MLDFCGKSACFQNRTQIRIYSSFSKVRPSIDLSKNCLFEYRVLLKNHFTKGDLVVVNSHV